MSNWIHFGAQHYQKYALNKKKSSSRSCSELNFIWKSLRAHMSISPTSEAGGSKDQYIWNSKMYRNGKAP